MEHPAVVALTARLYRAECPCGWEGTETGTAMVALDEADAHMLGLDREAS